jgi:TIGR03009 family protein
MTRVLFVFSLLGLFAQSSALAQVGAGPIVQPGPGGPPSAGPAAVAAAIPQPPEWANQMRPEEIKWIDDVLRFWEARSDKIKLFECKFQRWDYDGGYVNAAGVRQPRSFSEGVIKYAQPDKGLYRVEKLVLVQPPAQPDQKPQYLEQSADLGEHWICDGQKVFSFEANKKQVTVNPLPPEMQGKAIADGPLPFMFGAKAETIKARYWIRNLPNGPAGKYWLEAIPKSRQDAQNFKQVRIILEQQDFLPESLEIFAPNFNPPQNDARQTYVFSNREAKDDATIKDLVTRGLDPFGLIRRDFFNPKIPLGWKLVDMAQVQAGPPPQQAGPVPPQRQVR